MKIFYTAFILTLSLLIVSSQNIYSNEIKNFSGKNKITGKVIDAKSKEPLIGANILINGSNIGTATNLNGEFEIHDIPTAEFSISISMIGYRSKSINIQKEVLSVNPIQIELSQALIEMGTVVVTGTNSMHLYENVPVKTEIVTKKLMQQQGACNLAQSLGLQTGVMVENDCNNCNFTQVRILGFDGKYSQILIDGDPVVSALGGVYGLEHYPQEMIEQIEIVKGGGSSLYGGGAVAGTINMMTKRPAFNSTRVGYDGSSANGSYDHQIGAVAEMVNDDNTAGFFIFGSTRNRDAYDHNNDGFTELGTLKNETIGINSYFKPFESSELQASFHRIFEERRGGDQLDKPVHEAAISEWVQHFKYGGKLKWQHNISPEFQYKAHYSFSILERNSYYGGLNEDTPQGRLDALNYYGFSKNPLHTGGVSANYILDNHSLTAGFQYDYDDLLDQSVSSEAYYVDETFTNAGVFVQDEISIGSNNQFNIVAGVRLDKHSALENWIISPRLSAKYQLFESLKIRAGYTSGFKAPQIFDEDLHICGLEGTQRVIRNAVGLKEEKSSTISLGFEFLDFVSDIPLLIGVTGFYTNLLDAYADEFISANGNIEYWERINSSGAIVKGVEFDLGIKPIDGLEFRSGFTIKENKYKDNVTDFDTKNFFRTPDYFGYARASYEFGYGLSAFAALKYTGSMFVPHEIVVDYQDDPILSLTETDKFIEIDFALTKELQLFSDLKTSLTLGIKNLTNAYQKDLDYGVTRDPGYVYGPSQPRTVYFALRLNI